MPYTGPHIQSTGGLMSESAGAALGQGIGQALMRYQEEQKKKEFNQGMFDLLSQEKDDNGNSYIPTESLAKWHSMTPDRQAGVLALAGAKFKEDHSARMLAAQNKADRGDDAPTVIDPYIDPATKQTVPGMGVVRKTGQVQRTGGGAVDDPDQFGRYWNGKQWVQLHKDKVDPQVAMATMDRQNQIANLTQQIAEHQAAVDRGEETVGGVFGIGSTPRSQVIAGLKAKRDALVSTGGASAGSAPAPSSDGMAAPAPAAGAPKRVASKADYDALASGTTYLAPDGTIRRKP